jgi:hypothetical protein
MWNCISIDNLSQANLTLESIILVFLPEHWPWPCEWNIERIVPQFSRHFVGSIQFRSFRSVVDRIVVFQNETEDGWSVASVRLGMKLMSVPNLKRNFLFICFWKNKFKGCTILCFFAFFNNQNSPGGSFSPM